MYIEEYFGDAFFKKLPLGYHRNFSFGQFFITHAYYPHENLQLWRPVPDPNEPTKTFASHFQLVDAGQDAFSRTIPLAVPKLGVKEEFLVIRAKRRPVVLIMPEPAPLGVNNQGFRGKVQRHLCLVAQVYGLADPKTKQAEFSPSFVNRVRKMEFPQLMFLPSRTGILDVDSLLRLDELQSVFTPNLEALQFALGDEAAKVLRGQLQYLFAGAGPSDYTLLREEILNS